MSHRDLHAHLNLLPPLRAGQGWGGVKQPRSELE